MNGFVQLPRLEDLPMPLTDRDQSSFAWFKFAHVDFLLNPKIGAMSLVEQGALLRLMSYAARQVPFGSLPNDPVQWAFMVGLSKTRWSKIEPAIFNSKDESGLFKRCQDGRWYCSLMTDALTPVSLQQDQATDADTPSPVPPKKSRGKKPVDPEISNKRSAAANARWNNEHAKADTSTDANLHTHDMQNQDLHDAKQMQNANLHDANDANEGDIGGDKDLDQELDLDKKQTHSSESPEKSGGKFLEESKEIFDFWKKTFQKSERTVFDNKRKTKVLARLKDGYSVDQLKQAITGCASSEYHVENHHIDLELICRDATHTDRFIGLATASKKPKLTTQQDGKVNQYWQDQRKGIENDGYGRMLTPEEKEAFRQKTLAEGYI